MNKRLLDRAYKALQDGKVLRIAYQGSVRDIEVHAVGLSSRGKTVIRAFQTHQDLLSNPGWKLFDLEYLKDAVVQTEASEAPREGYNMDDKLMTKVLAQIELKKAL